MTIRKRHRRKEDKRREKDNIKVQTQKERKERYGKDAKEINRKVRYEHDEKEEAYKKRG